jgi:NADPH:quinone reductase-like Zn-dependent oxidoreductase
MFPVLQVDPKLARGNLRLVVKHRFPGHVPGRDLAGVVTAVGSSVTRVSVGDAVYADLDNGGGAFAQYATFDQKYAALKPASLSFKEATSVPLAAVTALGALEGARVTTGSKVVIVGASGGVGIFALQIAKLLGATNVIAVCSGKNAEFVKGFGADSVVDYTKTKLGAAVPGQDVDVVLDCVGGKEQWDEAQKVMAPKGRFVTLTGDDAAINLSLTGVLSLVGNLLLRKSWSWFGRQHGYTLHAVAPGYAQLDRLSAWFREGKLRTSIDKTFAFDQAGVVAMYEYNEAGRTRGKAVLEIVKE